MATSRYIQITEWALLEYEYADEQIQTNVAKAFKIENAYTESYQFINGDTSLNVTGNVQDRTSVRQSTVGNKWAYLDIDTIIPTLESDPKLTVTEETNNLTNPYIEYDRVKIHIVSGFNLDGLDGIIAQLTFKDRAGKNLEIAGHTFLSSESHYTFNTNPLFLGDRLYDKYIEFKVPSLSSVQSEFMANPANVGSFSYVYSLENTGFEKDSFIDFTLHEITKTDEINGNLFFITGNKYNLSFLPADTFGLLSSTVRESDEGDYFEFFGTWDGRFMEDYIARLNESGGDWVIIHQLDLFEQVGADSFRTANLTILQENNFDKPNIYRPVILNSAIAFSFSIDYTMRFMNRKDGSQTIRNSSFSSYEPKKYGKEIEKITVSEGYRPMKVYNKIVSGDEQSSTTSFQQNSPATFKTITTTKYVPNFFSNTNISITTNGKDTQELDENIWGQGKAIILLNEFDNRIRFKLFDKSPTSKELQQLNLTTAPTIFLSFVYDNGTKLYIEQSLDNNVDPTAGEVEFLIKGDDAVKILEQDNKNFYVVSRGGEDDTETVLYQGAYENFVNRDDVTAKLTSEQSNDIKQKIKTLRDEQTKFNKQEDELDVKIAQEQAISNQLDLKRKIIRKVQRFVSTQVKVLRDAEEKQRIKLAKDSRAISKQRNDLIERLKDIRNPKKRRNSKFRFKEIPGRSVDLSSGFKRIKPKVIKPSSPKTTLKKLRSKS